MKPFREVVVGEQGRHFGERLMFYESSTARNPVAGVSISHHLVPLAPPPFSERCSDFSSSSSSAKALLYDSIVYH